MVFCSCSYQLRLSSPSSMLENSIWYDSLPKRCFIEQQHYHQTLSHNHFVNFCWFWFQNAIAKAHVEAFKESTMGWGYSTSGAVLRLSNGVPPTESGVVHFKHNHTITLLQFHTFSESTNRLYVYIKA